MIKSAYIHIPFCIKKCNYCSFISGTNLEMTGLYTDSLVSEIKKFYRGDFLGTIYFGGGTPSLLSTEETKKILSCLNFDPGGEITYEVNPKTCNLNKFKALKNLGINRISLGVQAFEDRLLKIAGRIHSADEAKAAIEDIKNAEFENFSIDLIYGLPGQSISDWEKTLKIARNCGSTHISLYGLKIEEGTNFALYPPKNLPDDDIQADMYEAALDALSDWNHYEFSNFAREEKYRSRHNLAYWNLTPYYGFGLGASGFIDNMRYQNECNMEKYIKNPEASKNFEAANLLEEHIFLGFRKIEGINTTQINRIFNIDFDKLYAPQLKKYLASGHIQKTLHGYALSKNGIMLSNSILCEFLG